MELDYARTLAQPLTTGGPTARIFTRDEAAQMARAADALDASDDPADRPLADAARGAVGQWQDAE